MHFQGKYHPEAGPGLNNSRYLIQKFIELMKNDSKNKKFVQVVWAPEGGG